MAMKTAPPRFYSNPSGHLSWIPGNKNFSSQLSTDGNLITKFQSKLPGGIMADQHDERDHISEVSSSDGIDRRGFLSCMAWAGAGLVWTFSGGVGASRLFGATKPAGQAADFTFVQISDSHIGFDKAANSDVTATLQAAIDKINALPREPDLILHTGDLSHLSKPGEFDTLDQVL